MFVTFIVLYKFVIAVLFLLVFMLLMQTAQLGSRVEAEIVAQKVHVTYAWRTFWITIIAVLLTEALTWINGRHYGKLRTVHLWAFAIPFFISLCLLMARNWIPFLGKKGIHLPLACCCFVACIGMNITGDLLLLFYTPIASHY